MHDAPPTKLRSQSGISGFLEYQAPVKTDLMSSNFAMDEIRALLIEKIKAVVRSCDMENDICDITVEIESLRNILSFIPSNGDVFQRVDIILKETLAVLNDIVCTPVVSGYRGRPRIIIPEDLIEFLIDSGFSQNDISSLIGVSKRTLNRRLSEMGITFASKFSTMSDEELDGIVFGIVKEFPDVGYRTVGSHLKSIGHQVQRCRLRESIYRVDFEGVLQRRTNLRPILRRQYSVRAPLSLWHMDGYHKLISWKLVIHGAIDGYSRLPVFLNVSNNNQAGTVMTHFLKATSIYGLPERVRSDKGGENVLVAKFMLDRRGIGSFLTGRSVHNQRIERLWRDVWDGCVSLFYRIFCLLEFRGMLQSGNDIHLMALHYVFLPRIQNHLDRFCEAYIRKPIRTANNRSPLQLWISGQMLDPRPYSDEVDNAMYAGSTAEHLDVEAVEVEPLPDIASYLQNQVHPMDESDSYGMDLFLKARDMLINIIQ